MALRTVHLCQFNYDTQDIRVINSEVDGGTALNGTSDTDINDGGGLWQGDWSGFDFGGPDDDDRAATLAWRATQAGLNGGRPALIDFCDRHHQPVYDLHTVPHDDDTPFDDGTDYVSPGAECTVVSVDNGQAGGLNCTLLTISLYSERQLLGGERFSYIGANGWGKRAAEILSVEQVGPNLQIAFDPPVRGGIAAGDSLDFDSVGCVMKRTSQPSNALQFGKFSAPGQLTLVEYMLPVPA